MGYARPQSETLARRLAEPRRFIQAFVGGDGIPVQDFLLQPVEHWVKT